VLDESGVVRTGTPTSQFALPAAACATVYATSA
jgi:hypothetical protein